MSDDQPSPTQPATNSSRLVLFRGDWSIDCPQFVRGVRMTCFGARGADGTRPVVAQLELTVEELELLVAMARVRAI